MVVEHADLGLHARPTVFQPCLHGRELLGAQVAVGFVSAYRIVELGERGHTQRGIVAGEEFPSVGQLPISIPSGIDPQVHIGLRILHGRDARREREAADDDVVLYKELQVGAVEPTGIVA